MGYDLSKTEKDFSIQDLANIVGQNAMQMGEMFGIVSNTAKKVDDISDRMDKYEKRLHVIEEEKEVSSAQRKMIRRTASRRICEVLGVNVKKGQRTKEEKEVYALYSRKAFGVCYSEVQKLGHLSYPIECTPQKFYNEAIKDIDAWYPANGLAELKREAEEERIARMGADKLALLKRGGD